MSIISNLKKIFPPKKQNNIHNEIEEKLIVERKKENINKGHIYLTTLLSEKQKIKINEKYNKLQDFVYIPLEETKTINYNQFSTISKNISTFSRRYLNLKPIEDDIYINEIYFLKFLNNKLTNTYISAYWEFNYCIFDKDYVINKLLNKEYLDKDLSKERYLKTKTISQLKELLKNNSIVFKSSEKKQHLIELVINNNVELDIIPTYFLTKKGEVLVDKCKIYFLNNSIDNPIEEKDLQEKEDLYYWYSIYKEKYIKDFLFGLLRNLNMSYYKLNNDLLYLFNSFIIDISGLTNNVYENPENILIVNLYKNKFSKNEYYSLIDKSIYDELPNNYLSKEEILTIINKINQ